MLVERRGTRLAPRIGSRGLYPRAITCGLMSTGVAVLDTQGFVPIGEVVDGMEVVDKLCAIYGDVAPFGAGPNPTKIELVGNSYLDREFPRIDSIKTARVSLK